jgi:hypothetical protein
MENGLARQAHCIISVAMVSKNISLCSFFGEVEEYKTECEELVNSYNFSCAGLLEFGECSAVRKPQYCDNGVLVDNCVKCGCPTGMNCNNETNHCVSE